MQEAKIINESGRLFVALRKDGPAVGNGRTAMYHAVTPHCRMALCATEPGAASGWAEPPSDEVTCRICLEKLARLRKTDIAPTPPQARRAGSAPSPHNAHRRVRIVR
jgi:hypothetical protein